MMHETCVYYQLHNKWIAHLNNDTKGGNSGCNEIANNKDEF